MIELAAWLALLIAGLSAIIVGVWIMRAPLNQCPRCGRWYELVPLDEDPLDEAVLFCPPCSTYRLMPRKRGRA